MYTELSKQAGLGGLPRDDVVDISYLSRIFRAPELLREVPVLAVAGAVHGNLLPPSHPIDAHRSRERDGSAHERERGGGRPLCGSKRGGPDSVHMRSATCVSEKRESPQQAANELNDNTRSR